ncbi:hypothetical protein VTN00DRAFT_4222 [Thermoascus crustaceus]|uniref:uncharacterized protein n=1 Tax=Thermoascus crustaceus TaxID=5088 RepID=UPI0037434EF5
MTIMTTSTMTTTTTTTTTPPGTIPRAPPERFFVPPTAHAPNSPLPILLYRDVLPRPHGEASASAFLERNGWQKRGTWGAITTRHFHPNTHECYGIISGSSTLLLGLGGNDTAPNHDEDNDKDKDIPCTVASTSSSLWGWSLGSKMLKVMTDVMMGIVRNKTTSVSSAAAGSSSSTGTNNNNNNNTNNNGGGYGLRLKVSAGDVIVLPAGTAHCSVDSQGGFRYVGVYPVGSPRWRNEYGKSPIDLAAFQAEIAGVATPVLDPVYGVEGYLPALWKESAPPIIPSSFHIPPTGISFSRGSDEVDELDELDKLNELEVVAVELKI